MKKLKKIIDLPRVIKVKIVKGDSGVFIADLYEHGIHTEAVSLVELDAMVNDLIYAYFDVPKEFWGIVRYQRKELKTVSEILSDKSLPYEPIIPFHMIPRFL